MLSEEYLAWNTAIFETIFTLENGGQPVYLDLDDEVLEKLQLNPALPSGVSIEDLVLAVKNTLDLTQTQTKIFRPINLAMREWAAKFNENEETAGAPPILPLLAVTVLAAEKMGSGDHAPNAYYSHLFDLLDITDERLQGSLQNGYMRVAEYYWDVLNRWLTVTGGIYGAKSAFSISHRYIGLPISQALVRDVDRKKLPKMFSTLMLTPGAYLDPREMEQLFNLWLQREDSHVSNGLKGLWNKDAARQRISEVLCGELQNWDGSYVAQSARGENGDKHTILRESIAARLTLQITRFPSNNAQWGIGLSTSEEELGDIWFTDAPTEHFTATQARKGFQTIDDVSQTVFKNAIPCVVELETESGASFRRVPKTLIALQFDPDIQRFVEVDQIGLGLEIVLLVQNEPALQARLTHFLGKNSQPGWKAWTTNPSVPENWTFVEGVRIFSVETDEKVSKGFETLVPRAAGAQLVLSAGVKIPGTAQRNAWLKNYSPSVTALSQTVGDIKLEISKAIWNEDSLDYEVVRLLDSNQGTVFTDTRDLNLSTGDYKVSLFEKSKLVHVREFQIVDDNTYNPLALRQRKTLMHTFKSGISDLYYASAGVLDESFEGFAGIGHMETVVEMQEPEFQIIEWQSESDESASSRSSSIEFSEDLPSCYSTGAHFWDEDNMCRGKAPFVLGTCRFCKRKILMACSSREAESTLKKIEQERRDLAILRNVRNLTPVEEPIILQTTDWAAVVSLVIYAVHGTYSSLCSAITPLSSKNLSPEKIVETLYLMGLIELTSDALGKPKTWAIVLKQAIRDLETDTATLAGAWDKRSIAVLESVCEREGIEFTYTQEGLSFGEVGTSDVAKLERLFKHGKLDVDICLASDLADALPNLSDLIAETTRTNLPGYEAIDRFDFLTGQWVKQDGFLTTGALRLQTKLGVRYFYVDSKDLEFGRGVSCSATMAKYIAANQLGKQLLWQGTDETYVYAPFGALPPGLFTRALVSLCLVQPKPVRYKGPGSQTDGIKAYKLGPHYGAVINQVISKLSN